MNQFRIFLGRAAADGFERGARNAKVFRRNDQSPHGAVANFGDLRFTRKRDLIQATGTMNYERAGRAELRQRGCNRVDYIRGENAEHLRFGARRVSERAKKIKDRALHDLLPRGHGVARRRVRRGGEQKTDANFTHRAAGYRERQINVYAKDLENIRGAAAGADGTVAMLGNASTRRRRDNRRGGGYVERAGFVAACTACIDKSRGARLILSKNRRSVLSHNAGESS